MLKKIQKPALFSFALLHIHVSVLGFSPNKIIHENNAVVLNLYPSFLPLLPHPSILPKPVKSIYNHLAFLAYCPIFYVNSKAQQHL